MPFTSDDYNLYAPYDYYDGEGRKSYAAAFPAVPWGSNYYEQPTAGNIAGVSGVEGSSTLRTIPVGIVGWPGRGWVYCPVPGIYTRLRVVVAGVLEWFFYFQDKIEIDFREYDVYQMVAGQSLEVKCLHNSAVTFTYKAIAITLETNA